MGTLGHRAGNTFTIFFVAHLLDPFADIQCKIEYLDRTDLGRHLDDCALFNRFLEVKGAIEYDIRTSGNGRSASKRWIAVKKSALTPWLTGPVDRE